MIGSIGVRSGPIGAVLAPIEHGARAWAADANARGGLNGHPVRVVFGDDGGDPNKAVSLVRRMIDQDKAVAFFADQAPGTLHSIMPLLEKAQIPIFPVCNCSIGADGRNPMTFNVIFGGDLGMVWSHFLPAVALSDKKKVSVFCAREVPVPCQIRDKIKEIAPQYGRQVVHSAEVSITQPDYTAEVLAARNAGAEVLVVAVDNATTIRIIRSAHRQSYEPLISSQFSAHDARFLQSGGQDVEGVLSGAMTPHWESPKMADYRNAMARYVPNAILGSGSGGAYVTGKLIEVVAKTFPAGPVASSDFLNGLYSLKGETLGGLVPPLTYKPGENHDLANLCNYPTKIQGGKFVQQSDTYACPPGWTPVKA